MNAMSSEWFDTLTGAVRQRVGWRIPEKDYPKLAKVVSERMAVHHLSRQDDYVTMLLADGIVSQGEWRELVNRLTVQESYFFRDKGQFSLLRERILPELIRRNELRRSLRIWSAGCSSGEEPYSIAMLLEDLLPRQKGLWQVCILGTDINEAALLKAQRAVYARWAFRGVPSEVLERFFTPLRQEWQLSPHIRAKVQFQAGNLYVDSFPDRLKGLHDFDLILCRNVFIYLHEDAVMSIIRKFAGCLSQGGYLLTAHTELQGVTLKGFTVRVFPGAVMYQYQGESPGGRPEEMKLSLPQVVTGIAANSQFQTRPARISSATVGQSPVLSDISGPPAKPMEREPQERTELLMAARAHANQGRYEEAARTARQAIEMDATVGPAYFLLAQIAAHQGQVDEALAMFRRTIYLDPCNVAAYLELASLYEQLNHPRRAKKMRVAALDLLAAMPPGQMVEPYEPMMAGELAVFVKNMLSELDKNLNRM